MTGTDSTHERDRHTRRRDVADIGALVAGAAVLSVIALAGTDLPVAADVGPPRPAVYVAGGMWGGG